jgi:hypothetical protein
LLWYRDQRWVSSDSGKTAADDGMARMWVMKEARSLGVISGYLRGTRLMVQVA